MRSLQRRFAGMHSALARQPFGICALSLVSTQPDSCIACSPDDAKSEPARSAPATDADGGEQTLVAYLESHSVIRNMRGALELCLRQDPPLATEQALQFVATELAKLAR